MTKGTFASKKERNTSLLFTGKRIIPAHKWVDKQNILELPVWKDIQLLQLTYDHNWIGLDLVEHCGIVYIYTAFPILLPQIR